MCDTFRQLYPTQAALELDDAEYPRSWELNGKVSTRAPHGAQKVDTWQ